ncbi:unnamed protein product [Sphenostylis stenocarpa]|uniref:Guanine nucleotide-binding protein subunit beta-like protein n=1 Tax=Sphenostylis stenocarpa TaxID=92480 RepID=A0AA86VK63_9FABA|nr:unnamed protein product [Sphenostylis stenocarpa]
MTEAEVIIFRGTLRGHTDKVTAISTNNNPNIMVSSSHDKTLIVWRIRKDSNPCAFPTLRLTGHSEIISDAVLSSHGEHVISSSWDGELRLWNITNGHTKRRFVGHTNQVLSVSLFDDSVIASGGRDNTVRVWNAWGQCMATLDGDGENGHTDWVSCVRFIPAETPRLVTAAWDGSVRVWDLDMSNKGALVKSFATSGHEGRVNAVALPPDGSVIASVGNDGVVIIWDMEGGVKLYEFDVGCVVLAMCFSPNRFWLSVATEDRVIVWDLESKKVLEELEVKKITDFSSLACV